MNGILPCAVIMLQLIIFSVFSYHLNFENSHENGLLSISETTACLFNNFLNHHLNPYLLKSVNLNGVYWVEPDILEKFLIQCKQVEKLEVAETNLSTERIVAHILPHCPSVTSLSFSMDRSIELHRNGPVLLQGGPALSKLLSVEIIMKRDEDSSYRNLVEFLMYIITNEMCVFILLNQYFFFQEMQ